MGFANVASGEWVVCGESGECYVMEDAAFRRLFCAVREKEMHTEAKSGVREKMSLLAFRASLRKRLHVRRAA
jgi:hypothetical protein